MGFAFHAGKGAAEFIRDNGSEAQILHWPLDRRRSNTPSHVSDEKIDIGTSIPKGYEENRLDNDYLIRCRAVHLDVWLNADRQVAKRFVEAMSAVEDMEVRSRDEYG